MKISMYMGVDYILKKPHHICCAFDRNIVNFHQDHSTTFVVLYDNIVVKLLVKLVIKIAMYMGVDNILMWPHHICCAFNRNIVNFYQDHCTTFVVLYDNIVVKFLVKLLIKIAMYMGVDNILMWPHNICCAFHRNIVQFSSRS